MSNEKEGFFKKMFYTGLGLALTTKEAIDRKIDELVEKNKISVEEGKKIMSDITSKFDKNKENIESELKEFVHKTSESLKFAKKKDVDELNSRLDEIDSKLEKLGTTV